jgi:amidase
MTTTLEDLTFYTKTVIDAQPWLVDPKCVPIPWRPVEPKQKLKIAVLWNDGVVAPTPPVARAMKETVEKLKAAGHELVEWDPRLHGKAVEFLVGAFLAQYQHQLIGAQGRMFVADGGKSVRKLLEPTGEPIRPEMRPYEVATELGVYDMWQLHLERSELQREYLELWSSYGDLDAILSESKDPYIIFSNCTHMHRPHESLCYC